MLMTSQLKVGTAIMYEGNPLIVQKMLGQRSGRAGTEVSFKKYRFRVRRYTGAGHYPGWHNGAAFGLDSGQLRHGSHV